MSEMGAVRFAQVRELASRRTHSVRKGDVLQEMQVLAVEKDRLILAFLGERDEIRLAAYTASGRVPAPPPPPPPPPEPQPPQPPPPACTPAQICPVCPSLPRCSPQSPTTIGPAKVCNPGGACGQAWLHVWNGDQQVFWKLGSEQHVERIVNGLTVQSGIEIASLWIVPEIQGLWQADNLSRVVAVGLASQENDPRKPIEEQQRYEERRACIRAARLHDSLPAVVPPSKRFVMSLGQHQVSHRATDTAQQRPVVMVTVLNEPVGMDLDAELRRLMATHPGWRLAFDAYSQGGAGKALVSKVKDCGS